jgi:hypothetical protein
LYHHKTLTIKKAVDNIKKKISDVLKLFKDQLEDKNQRKINELEKRLKNEEPQKEINQSTILNIKQDGEVLERLEPSSVNQKG